MTAQTDSTSINTWVAIDVAKLWNVVLIEGSDGRRRFRVANTKADHDRFVAHLRSRPGRCRIALEPTGNYHRPLAYRLRQEGFEVFLISSVAAARYREALFNSWDKNDPKDAAVILQMLKEGRVIYYHDAIVAGINDLQELSKTYFHVSLARTRLQHSLLTHYLPLCWPEFARYWRTSRNDWFVTFLHRFPTPATVRALDQESFIREAWPLVGRKVSKQARLEEMYELAGDTIGLPLDPDSFAIRTFKLQLSRYLDLNHQRAKLELWAEEVLQDREDARLLRTIPGIGAVLALVIIAEAGDLRRFGHHRQFLKFCGLDLAKSQSGNTRGQERLSKRGNSRLRYALWFAGAVAVRQRENSFRDKYERYISPDPKNPDRKRMALTAIAAKMGRVAYGLVKTGTPYRAYFESAVPSGSISIKRAVEA